VIFFRQIWRCNSDAFHVAKNTICFQFRWKISWCWFNKRVGENLWRNGCLWVFFLLAHDCLTNFICKIVLNSCFVDFIFLNYILQPFFFKIPYCASHTKIPNLKNLCPIFINVIKNTKYLQCPWIPWYHVLDRNM